MKHSLTPDEMKARLNCHGLKATPQRMAIFKSICETDEHPSTEQIYEAIKSTNPTISLATVYKTLETLAEVGLIAKIKTDENIVRYDAGTDSHNHVYCTRTNKVIDYHDRELNDLIANYLKSKQFDNFEVSDFQVQITGQIVDESQRVVIS